MHLSVDSASVSPGCLPSPTITWQQGFMMVSLLLCPQEHSGSRPWQRYRSLVLSLSWCWNLCPALGQVEASVGWLF